MVIPWHQMTDYGGIFIFIFFSYLICGGSLDLSNNKVVKFLV